MALYSTAEFQQINVGWSWETIVSDKKSLFSNCGKNITVSAPSLPPVSTGGQTLKWVPGTGGGGGS